MRSTLVILSTLITGLLPLSLHHAASFRSVPDAFSASKPSLMATEQEVRRFFDQYTERYDKMDIDGFLSLFSVKAKQNQQDGLPEIRKMYSDYFNRMTSLRISVENMKIELYQNAVEVKARYAVAQVLKKEGEKKAMKGSGRWVLIKEDGMLKILSIDYKHEKTP